MTHRQRKRFVPRVIEAARFVCPECHGNVAIPCTHCGSRGYVVCGSGLHVLEGSFEWPDAGGTYATCKLCRSTVLQVANDALGNRADVNEAA